MKSKDTNLAAIKYSAVTLVITTILGVVNAYLVYLMSYLIILGNTFMLGAVREASKGALPCVMAAALLNSFVTVVAVGYDIIKILVLAVIEIIISTVFVFLYRHCKTGQNATDI